MGFLRVKRIGYEVLCFIKKWRIFNGLEFFDLNLEFKILCLKKSVDCYIFYCVFVVFYVNIFIRLIFFVFVSEIIN